MQVVRQLVPLHVGTPFGSAGHAAQTPPQSLYPLLQVRPQVPAVHVATPFVSVGHGVHDEAPQEAVEALLEHELPQRW